MAFFGALGELALGQIPAPSVGGSHIDDVGAGYAKKRKRKLYLEDQFKREREDAEGRRLAIAEAVVGPSPSYEWNEITGAPIFTPQTGELTETIYEARNTIQASRNLQAIAEDELEIEQVLSAKDIEEKGILMDCPHCGKAIRRMLD